MVFGDQTQEGSRLSAEFQLGPDSLVCGTVARLHPQKGICYLVEAFARLRTHFPNLKLLIVGDGPERAGLVQRATNLGVSQDVLFAGHRNPPVPYLKLMKVFILPSLYEGFPNALLEAMAACVPVVASDVGGVNELVRHGVNGLLVPPANPSALAEAIQLLLLNPDRAKQLASSAFDQIQKEFSLEGMLKEYDDLYEELLSNDTCCGHVAAV